MSITGNQQIKLQLNLDDAPSSATSDSANVRITEEIFDEEVNERDNVRWVFSPPFHLYSPQAQDNVDDANEAKASARKTFSFPASSYNNNNKSRKLEIEIEKLSE